SKKVIWPPVSVSGSFAAEDLPSSWLSLVMCGQAAGLGRARLPRSVRVIHRRGGSCGDRRFVGAGWGRGGWGGGGHGFGCGRARGLERLSRFRQDPCRFFNHYGSGVLRRLAFQGNLLGLFPFCFPRLPLDGAHLFFKCHLEVSGGLTEFSHHLAQTAGKLWQFVRAENHQHHDKDDNQMGNTEHDLECSSDAPLWHHHKGTTICHTSLFATRAILNSLSV